MHTESRVDLWRPWMPHGISANDSVLLQKVRVFCIYLYLHAHKRTSPWTANYQKPYKQKRKTSVKGNEPGHRSSKPRATALQEFSTLARTLIDSQTKSKFRSHFFSKNKVLRRERCTWTASTRNDWCLSPHAFHHDCAWTGCVVHTIESLHASIYIFLTLSFICVLEVKFALLIPITLCAGPVLSSLSCKQCTWSMLNTNKDKKSMFTAKIMK